MPHACDQVTDLGLTWELPRRESTRRSSGSRRAEQVAAKLWDKHNVGTGDHFPGEQGNHRWHFDFGQDSRKGASTMTDGAIGAHGVIALMVVFTAVRLGRDQARDEARADQREQEEAQECDS